MAFGTVAAATFEHVLLHRQIKRQIASRAPHCDFLESRMNLVNAGKALVMVSTNCGTALVEADPGNQRAETFPNSTSTIIRLARASMANTTASMLSCFENAFLVRH
jgi:hypothetical protein